MKKSTKIILTILSTLLAIIIIDTIQAKLFSNSPLIKIRKNLDGGILDYIDNGILVKSYSYINNEKVTVFNWEKYSAREFVKQKNNLSNNDQQEKYKKYSKTIDEVILELSIPEEWKYEEETPKKDNKSTAGDIDIDNYKFALKIYKNSKEKNVILYVRNSPFGICGTGLVTKKIKLNNGENATADYYDGSKTWSFISLSKSNIIILLCNNGLEELEANEVLDFVKTINIDVYEKIKDANLKAEGIDTKTLVRFNGILYGESYKILEYIQEPTNLAGEITKLIDNIYVPKYNNETNTKEILNALVYDATDEAVFIKYQNSIKLFEKIEEN